MDRAPFPTRNGNWVASQSPYSPYIWHSLSHYFLKISPQELIGTFLERSNKFSLRTATQMRHGQLYIGLHEPHRLNDAAELSSYCPLHAFPLSVPLQAWLGAWMWPKFPSKLICCTSADDRIFMLWTQLTNSLCNQLMIGILRQEKGSGKRLSTMNKNILLTPKDRRQLKVYHFHDPHKQVSNQCVEDLLTALQCQTCGQDHV